jgi:hypothetical protein
MEEIGSSEYLVTSYQMTRRHLPEDGTLHSDCQKNFKSREHNIFLKDRPTCIAVTSSSSSYGSADKSLARTPSRCILFDSENISFDASLVIYINSTNIPAIMIINRIYETQNILSL